MIYGWIIGGLAALDLGVKSVVEGQEDDTFPRDLPSAKGFIKLHKNHNSGFPFTNSGLSFINPKGKPLLWFL